VLIATFWSDDTVVFFGRLAIPFSVLGDLESVDEL